MRKTRREGGVNEIPRMIPRKLRIRKSLVLDIIIRILVTRIKI